MIDALSRYRKYKAAAPPWLGEIPETWSCQRLKTLFREVDRRSKTGTEKLLSLRMRRGLIGHLDAGGRPIDATALIGFKKTVPGQLVMNRMRAASGLFGVSPEPGLVSPDYAVFDSIGSANTEYFLELFRTPILGAVFRKESKGLGTGDAGFLRLYTDRFGMIPVPVPPPDEQAAIVKFLDHAARRIRKYIRAKQKLIKLLEEQKQAIIHQAVTRGLDPDAPTRSIGLRWIPAVPKHWHVTRMGAVFREVDRRSKTGEEELLSVSHITGVTPRSQKNITMFKAASYVGHKVCQPGELVVNTMWAWMGALGMANHLGLVSPSYAIYRLKVRNNHNYLDILLRGWAYVAEFRSRSTGIRSSRLRLYPEEFYRVPVALPPAQEQTEIVEHILERTRELRAAGEKAREEMRLLTEFRTRLISDVVTGKLDVRTAAAALPDEVEADEPDVDESDDDLDEDTDAADEETDE